MVHALSGPAVTKQIVSLELVFDDAADAAVRAEWAALAAADLPSQARHTGESNRPHTTLLVRPEIGGMDASPLDALLPVRVTLGAPVLFGGARHRVVARLVVPSVELLALHAAVHAAAGDGEDVDHTLPGSWTPHVTLARRVPVERVGDALSVLAVHGMGDISAHAVGIRRWDAQAREISVVAGRGTLDSC